MDCFFCFQLEIPFWVNLVQKLKIISLSWNFVLKLIQICRIPWWCSLFLFSTGNCQFELKLRTRLRGHSESTFAQNSRVLTLPPPLFVFEHLPPPPTPPPKLRSFYLELTLSPSISILVKFRENKLIMSISIFGWTQHGNHSYEFHYHAEKKMFP